MKKLSTFFTTLLVSVLLIGSTTLAQTTWNNGAGDGDWNNPLNWTAGLPTSGVDAIIDVSVAITAPTMSAAGACKSLSFTGVNAAYTGLVLNGKTLTVSGDVNLTGGRIVAGTGTISLTGSFTKGGGVFNVGTGTVIFAGTGLQTINDIVTFYNLTISTTGASARVIANAAVTVGNILTISGGAIFNDGGQTINLLGSGTPFVATGAFTSTGTVSYQGAGATNVSAAGYNNLDINKAGVTFTATGTLSVSGNLSVGATTTFADNGQLIKLAGNFTNSGTFTATGVMTVNGVVTQTLAGVTYNNLAISNTTATVNLNGTAITTVGGILTIDAGATLWDNNKQMGSVATLTNNGTLKLGGTSGTQFPVIGTAFTGGGTVEFAASVAQTINDPAIGDYNNVTLSGGNTKFVATGNNTVVGNLTIATGTTLTDNGKTIFLAGNFFNNGTYTTTGTLSFTGTANLTIPAGTYNNVTIVAGTQTANANFTVNGIFNIAGGTFVDAGKTISIGGTWTGTGGYTNTGTVVFVGSGSQTISTAEGFTNLTISSGTVTAQGNLTVANNFTIASGATFAAGGGLTHALSGGLSNAGTIVPSTSTINFAATGTITANSLTTFATVGITTGTVTLAGTSNISVGTAMTVSAGATLVTGTNIVTGAGSFSLPGAGSTLSFGNTGGITSAIQVTGGATFAGAGAGNEADFIITGTNQTLGTVGGAFPATVRNLTFAGSGTLTVPHAVTVSNNLFLTSGNVGGAANITTTSGKLITVKSGTLNASPTFGGGNINVTYTNTADFTSGKEIPTAFGVLKTLTTGAGTLFVGTSLITVNTSLVLGGMVSTASNTLQLVTGATITGASSSKYITGGNFAYQYTAAGALETHTYPIGTGAYRPVTLALDVDADSYITVNMVNASATALGYTLGTNVSKVSNVRYYNVFAGTAITTVGGAPTITLNYDTDDGVNENSSVIVATATATTWNDLAGSPGTAVTTGSVTNANPFTFALGKFVIANKTGGANALAVELVSFTGTSKDENISLSWTTATEHNNYGFNIERTVTGKSEWAEVGFVKGSGTSNSPKTYSFTDKVSGAASFDYRIKQTDVDGLSRYIGSVVTVTAPIPTEFALSQNYPNPFNPSTIIKYAIPQASFVSLKIYNMLGQEVATLVNGQTDIGFHSITWNGRTNAGSFASSGVYIYRIVAGNFVQVKKMNLLK